MFITSRVKGAKREGLTCNIIPTRKKCRSVETFVSGETMCFSPYALPLWAYEMRLLRGLHRNWREQTCLASGRAKWQLAFDITN